jgi:hypothetical protein
MLRLGETLYKLRKVDEANVDTFSSMESLDYVNILFHPKDFSSRHSLVHKSDASPLDLGIV